MSALTESYKSLASNYWSIIYFIIALILAVFVFSDALNYMLLDWQRDEFSHGYMIPLVSLYLILQQLPKLPGIKHGYHGFGIFLVVLGLMAYLLGELSAIYTIIQYGFVIVVLGIAVSLLGGSSLKVIGVPIFYLIFMIPLPNFLYFNLSSHLQLISSSLGVEILRLLDISVFLEGNIIDLGNLRLQVVDACSGLRYLFPLMSFGFLVAYIYIAPFWKKSLIFLSTVPITIFMNSFRIAVIGFTVDHWGIAAAEGFVHDFEGWVVFLACLGLLALEIIVIHRFSGRPGSPLDSISISLPTPLFSQKYFTTVKSFSGPTIIVLLLLISSVPLKFIIADRVEVIPARAQLNKMPLLLDSWVGREGRYDDDLITALKVKDYMLADYTDPASGIAINVYIAYYDSQRKGASVHSPKTCMPGGGWEMTNISELDLEGVESYRGEKLVVNRVTIQKGSDRNLVYYWFQQRGRIVTNEYLAKWYIFWDSLTRNRTDGALVRLTMRYSDPQEADAAEQKLQKFVKSLAPHLPQYIPE